jgi:hypothetical protein
MTAQLNVLTRWEMDLVRDAYGKFLYVADLDDAAKSGRSPDARNARLRRVRAITRRACHHDSTPVTQRHPGYVDHVRRDRATIRRALETSSLPTRLHRKCAACASASFFEWCCGVAPDVKREFHRLFFTTAYNEAATAAAASAPPRTCGTSVPRRARALESPVAIRRGTRRGDKFSQDLAIADKATFLGRYGNTANPAAMTGAAIRRHPASSQSPVASAASATPRGPRRRHHAQAGRDRALHYLPRHRHQRREGPRARRSLRRSVRVEAAITGAKKQWEKLD